MNTLKDSTQNGVTSPAINDIKPLASEQNSKQKINDLHTQFQTYGRNAKEWIRKCQLLLPQIRDEEVFAKKGFSSIYEYAAKLAGMSRNSVNEALRVLDKIEDKPSLLKSVEKYGINKVKPVVTIATENTQQFWANAINNMAQKTLEVYVREFKKDGLRAEGQRTLNEDDDMLNDDMCLDDADIDKGAKGGNVKKETKKAAVYMKLDIEVIEKLKQIKGDRDWNELMKDFLDSGEAGGSGRDEYEGVVSGGSGEAGEEHEVLNNEVKAAAKIEQKPKPVNTGKRYIPAKIKKYVIKKTNGHCAYPGCVKPYEILHHTNRFALDSMHDSDTLTPLCKQHERLAHSGLIENEELVPVNDGRVNWHVKTAATAMTTNVGATLSQKDKIDKVVNKYYMPSSC